MSQFLNLKNAISTNTIPPLWYCETGSMFLQRRAYGYVLSKCISGVCSTLINST